MLAALPGICCRMQAHVRLRMMPMCSDFGLSLSDMQRYQCCACSERFGHLRFDAVSLKNSKARGSPLRCKDCTALAKDNGVADKRRQQSLLARLAEHDSWRCSCNKFTKKNRVAAALDRTLHKETCDLFLYGVRRWDGKNKGITLDYLEFLRRRGAY